MIIRNFLSTIVIPLALVSALGAQESTDLVDAAAKRRDLLRDSSDLGIGLSLGKYRKDHLPDAIVDRASKDPKDRGPAAALSGLDYYRLGLQDSLSRELFRHTIDGRSPLYNWHAPVVRQHGNHWIIRPGHFHEYVPGFDGHAPGNLWTP